MNFIKKSITSQQFFIDTFNDFLVKGVDVNFTYDVGTPLSYIIEKQCLNTELIKALIQAGADVNYHLGPIFGKPLSIAIAYSNSKRYRDKQPWINVIKLLLSAGAEAHKSSKDQSILLEAQRQLQEEKK